LGLPEEETRGIAVPAVAERWATQEPQAAAQWLAQNTNAAIQRAGLARLMEVWAQDTPQAASQWVENLPAGAFHQSALESYADAVNRWAPDRAAQCAINLDDENIRYQKVEIALNHWLELDAATARQWIKESKLPPEMKERYLLPVTTP